MTTYLTSGFRTPERPTHNGVDYAGPVGSRIYANKAMTVVKVQEDTANAGGYGKHIVTADAQNNRYVFAHLDQIPEGFAPGTSIPPGGLLAYMGNTGTVRPAPTPSNPTAGTHLHFEVLERQGNQNKPVNPLLSIDPSTGRPYANNASFTPNSNPSLSSLSSSIGSAPPGYRQKTPPNFGETQIANLAGRNTQARPAGRTEVTPVPLNSNSRARFNDLFEKSINPVLKLGDK